MEKETDITKILDDYFSKTDKRFLDTTRIPRICDDIRDIRNNVKEGFENLEKTIEKKEDDHENRIRIVETFMNQMDGKASNNSVYVGYILSIAGILVGALALYYH